MKTEAFTLLVIAMTFGAVTLAAAQTKSSPPVPTPSAKALPQQQPMSQRVGRVQNEQERSFMTSPESPSSNKVSKK